MGLSLVSDSGHICLMALFVVCGIQSVLSEPDFGAMRHTLYGELWRRQGLLSAFSIEGLFVSTSSRDLSQLPR